jgi:hypothetical protein
MKPLDKMKKYSLKAIISKSGFLFFLLVLISLNSKGQNQYVYISSRGWGQILNLKLRLTL